MGQPVTFLRTASPRPGIVRFELNRTLTGMGHERYYLGREIIGSRPADELARRMLATNKIAAVHIHGSMVTAELRDPETGAARSGGAEVSGDGGDTDADIAEIIAELYTYYLPGVEIPPDSELIAMVPG